MNKLGKGVPVKLQGERLTFHQGEGLGKHHMTLKADFPNINQVISYGTIDMIDVYEVQLKKDITLYHGDLGKTSVELAQADHNPLTIPANDTNFTAHHGDLSITSVPNKKGSFYITTQRTDRFGEVRRLLD